jgi:site-specific recombinase XerD
LYSQTIAILEKFDNQHDFERMCADILNASGYKDVELIAPRGGSDGGKDITFTTQSGRRGLACVTLRKDIENKFTEDFSKRKAGEFDVYILFCTAYLTATQKQKFTQHCLYTLQAKFIPKDIETLRSALDSALLPIKEKYLHVAPGNEKLHIVVASPGDVEDELDALEKVATELNRGIAKDRALQIEISCWETDTFPSFHVEGMQGAVLNIEDCELLIGIFWKRFGTPTADTKSDPEQEVRKAYKAWKRYQRPHIMLYFNKRPYAPESRAELEQWGQVLEFQREISQDELAYSYTEKAQFERLVRNHLTQFIRRIPESSQKSFNTTTNAPIKTPAHNSPPIDQQVALWLEVKASNTQRTRDQYERNIAHYRNALLKYNLDLNSEDETVISSLFERWAKSGTIVKTVGELTYNQRNSIINSFYQFACEHHWMSSNPIERVKRHKEKRRAPEYTDNILNVDTIKETIISGLNSIDRTTPLGKRDYALLSILFTTLHRVSEVTNLKCGDISIKGSSVTVTWRKFRNGGDKRTTLSPDISRALIDYLEEAHGNDRPNDAPLWLSVSRFNKGEPIGIQAISAACERYLHINRVEKIRQTLKALGKREGTREVEKMLDIN